MTRDERHEDAPELLLSIGGIVGHFLLEEASAAFLVDLRRRYRAFCLPCSPAVARAFSLRVRFRGQRLTTGTVRQPRVRTGPSAPSIRAARFDLAVRLEAGHTDGLRGRARCQMTPFAFDSLLRVLWSELLPRAGGALFHACGFRDGERAILAPGPSGAGKSTLAGKIEDPDDVLNDEVVAIHRRGNGTWQISATPFFGELQRGGSSMKSWPLAGIAFLEKGPAIATRTLPVGEAVWRALGCLMCFSDDTATVQRNVALVIDLCRKVPVFAAGSQAETPIRALLAAWAPLLAGTREQPSSDGNQREHISALRSRLERHGTYAFRPRGGSMRPWLQSGDMVFVEAADHKRVRAGDVVVYWRARRSPEDDQLVCHRMLGRLSTRRGPRLYTKGDASTSIESFHDGREAEVLGRVTAVCRGGETWELPGRLASLGQLTLSLLMSPIIRVLERR